MNKLLKVTLITAIMATSGMCSDRCQHMTFNANITYSQSYTISHDNTWITETTGNSEASITGDVKITDRSRWIHNKGVIVLKGKDNIIDNSELINNGWIGVHDTGKLDIKDKSSILVKGYGRIVADRNNNSENGATINVDRSTISMKDSASICADNNSTINVDRSTIRLRDSVHIHAYEKGTINVDNSSISMKDSASICVHPYGTININEGSIFDARDSKYLGKWNTVTDTSTFNMEAGSIMYLPSTDIGAGKKTNNGSWPFTITLPSEGDKPVELRYIQHTDITFDGLCPNVTHSGYEYKLSDWKKGTDNDISYLQEPNTGIRFTWKGISSADTTIPPSIAKLVPIYTWSVSTKCNGEDVKILESRDLQCCDDILW